MVSPKAESIPVHYRAVWFGGPPGVTWKKLEVRLREVGIEVIEKFETYNGRAGLPPDTDLVLNCAMMNSASESDSARALAKAKNIPCVSASTDWSWTRMQLEQRGILDHVPAYKLAQEIETAPPMLRVVPSPEPARVVPLRGVDDGGPAALLRVFHASQSPELPAEVLAHLTKAKQLLEAHERAMSVVEQFEDMDDDTIQALLGALSPAQAARLASFASLSLTQ